MELIELFQAYYDCRKNKRNTLNALAFEIDYERKLIELYNDVISGRYEVGKSITFIVHHPVKREIFAGDFRDRIIHHFLIHKLNPIFEKTFIHDSYSCRIGKGTLFGIKRIESFIRSATDNYQKDAYILKLDIAGFFMNIDKNILFQTLESLIERKYTWDDKSLILSLCQKTIFNDPTKNCHIKWKREHWIWLPRNKSLFFSWKSIGLPIGNLTSQIFANLYLHPLDIFVKKYLHIKYYGRYVDDFVLIHHDREYLNSCIPQIQYFLPKHLWLELHPQKIHFQHYTKGVPFLGAYIRPYRTYIGNRTKGNFYSTIKQWNEQIRHCEHNEVKCGNPVQSNGSPHSVRDDKSIFLSSINSYLGIMKQCSTYRLRKKMLCEHMSASFWNEFFVSGGYGKVVRKKKRVWK